MSSSSPQDDLLRRKVDRFYCRIFGEKLIGKKPVDPSKATDAATSATTSSAAVEKKYSAAEAKTNTTPNAADVLMNVKTATALSHANSSTDFILLYFSASWCPPCRGFTPMLKSFFTDAQKAHLMSVTERADFEAAAALLVDTNDTSAHATNAPPLKPKLQVVFISGDQTYEACEEYFLQHHHNDWLMVPFDEVKVRDKLLQRFGVTALPTLIVLDAKTGKIVSKKGVSAIRHSHANGSTPAPTSSASGSEAPVSTVNNEALETFPWKESSIVEKLVKEVDITKRLPKPQTNGGATTDIVVGSNSATTSATATASTTAPTTKKVDLRKLDHFALYFASKSSAPCRAFTPLLTAMYEDSIMKTFGEEKTEVIFVSLDEDERHYESFRSQMPWAAIGHKHPILPYLLKELNVTSLPRLVTISVKDNGKILNSDARAAVGEDVEDFTADFDATDENNKQNSDKGKCNYPWARTKLPLVAPLVPSAEVVQAVKSIPCVVLATNNASNKGVLMAEFRTAAAAFAETTSGAGGRGTDGGADDANIDLYDPERDTSSEAATNSPADGGQQQISNETDSKRVQFFIADAGHVGGDTFLERLAMVLQENLPPSGVACVFSFYMKENLSGGMLKTVESKEIIEYTKRFVKQSEEASAASPAKNLSSLQPAMQGPRRPIPAPQGSASAPAATGATTGSGGSGGGAKHPHGAGSGGGGGGPTAHH